VVWSTPPLLSADLKAQDLSASIACPKQLHSQHPRVYPSGDVSSDCAFQGATHVQNTAQNDTLTVTGLLEDQA